MVLHISSRVQLDLMQLIIWGTKFKSFLYNVPPGLNYYTLEQTDLLDSDILLKVELFKNEK